MLIHCTKKLFDELGIKPSAVVEENPIFSWHANLVTLNRRKTLILVHDRSRYIIVVYGLKKKGFQKMDSLIIEAIRDAFLTECIDEEIINSFLDQAGAISYAKATDKSSITRLVKADQSANIYHDKIVENSMFQGILNRAISRLVVQAGKGKSGYLWPNIELYKDLAEQYGRPAVKCRAAILRVTFELDGFEVWRQILIPLNATFTMLHEVLQLAFGWKGCHLHEFYLFGEQGPVDEDYINHPAFHNQGFKPVLHLVSFESEDWEDKLNIPLQMEQGMRLSDVDFQHAKYIYDFGDFWRHYIDVEEIIEDHYTSAPILLDGSGDAPPEDVGGESGFEQFVRTMADKDDPDHEDMKRWAEGQQYTKFDLYGLKQRFIRTYR